MHAPIDAATLRALQAPLKELYREDPDEAVVHVCARADWRDPGVTASLAIPPTVAIWRSVR